MVESVSTFQHSFASQVAGDKHVIDAKQVKDKHKKEIAFAAFVIAMAKAMEAQNGTQLAFGNEMEATNQSLGRVTDSINALSEKTNGVKGTGVKQQGDLLAIQLEGTALSTVESQLSQANNDLSTRVGNLGQQQQLDDQMGSQFTEGMLKWGQNLEKLRHRS